MTVSEMIDVLKGHPGELRVVVNGYEEGYDDVSPSRISVRKIRLNTGDEWWQGRHGDLDDGPGPASPATAVEAMVIRRVVSD